MVFTRKIIIFALLALLCPLFASSGSPLEHAGQLPAHRQRADQYILPSRRTARSPPSTWNGRAGSVARPQWMADYPLQALSVYIAPTQEEFIRLSGGRLAGVGRGLRAAGH